MNKINWREIVEIVGVLSIVGSLLLLATEVKQSNGIATAEIGLNLQQNFNNVHIQRATNPEFSKLYAKIRDPDSHLITSTENEQIRGLAWHYINLYSAVQTAYDNGLLSKEDYQGYLSGLQNVLDSLPAVHEQIVYVLRAVPQIGDIPIFATISLKPEEPKENQ